MALFNLVYVSRAKEGLTEDDLLNIQRRAVSNNARSEITGVLLHSRGHFIQFLEGPPPNLAMLYAQIVQDQRHNDADCVLFAPAKERVFGDWSMGVIDLETIGDRSDTEKLWDVLSREVRQPGAQRDAALNTLREFERVLQVTGGVPESFV